MQANTQRKAMHKLRFLRKKLKISQLHLARLLGVSKTMIYYYENKYFNPSIEIANKIIKLGARIKIDIKLEELITDLEKNK